NSLCTFDLLTEKYQLFSDRFSIFFVYKDLIPFALGREKTNNGIGGEPFFSDDTIQHPEGIIVHFPGFIPYELIFKYLRKLSFELPALEIRRPVNIFADLLVIDFLKNTNAQFLRSYWSIILPVELQMIFPCLFYSNESFFARILSSFTDRSIFLPNTLHKSLP